VRVALIGSGILAERHVLLFRSGMAIGALALANAALHLFGGV
jgi:hypothetical protein